MGRARTAGAASCGAQYAELGLLGLPFAEDYGGSGGGPVETMIVMEAFGRALALEPYLATVVLGGGFLRHGGNAEQCAALIPKIADGSLTLAFAHTERQSRYNLADISTKAARDGAGWVLDGEKGVVLHGDSADRLIVTARVGRRPARARRDRPLSGRRQRLRASRAAAIRPRTGCARPRSALAGGARRPGRACWASRARLCHWSSASSTRRSRRSAPRRSARWR